MMITRRSNILNAAMIGIFMICALITTSCGDKESQPTGDEGRKVLYWKSSMDPSFISQRPGKDAMGMDLVPVYEGDPGADLSTIIVRGETLQRMGIRTEPVGRKQLRRSIRSVATIDYNERALVDVNMKFDGWIERLYVNETGQLVNRGEPLFDIYSPELFASAQEYLQALRGVSDAPHMEHLFQSARQRLEQFDLSEGDIDEIRKTGKAPRLLTIRAPTRGHVIHKQAFEGTFVKKGSPLFRIADLDTVWVYVDIYEYELPWLQNVEGAEMELTYMPGETFRGTIDYIYPFLDKMSRTVKVRLVFPNPDLVLKPGMFATVQLISVIPESVLVVPSEAVIHSGKRNLVLVHLGEGRFEPRELRLGRQGEGGDYEVLDGLTPGDEVVTSGQFLLDSESRLKEAIAKMLGSSITLNDKDTSGGAHDTPTDTEAVMSDSDRVGH